MATVAIQDTFLQAYARLPRAEQSRVRRLIEDLRHFRVHGSRHLERIAEAEDDKVYSVRISDAYRAIVVWPPGENVLLLVWADHHDEAYRWAKRKHFEVNPRTGVLQMWSTEETESGDGDRRAAPENGLPSVAGGLFASYTDEQLLNVGVPTALLPAVRRIATLDEFQRSKGNLPADAAEALQWLAAGEPYEAVLEYMDEWRAEVLGDERDEGGPARLEVQSGSAQGHGVPDVPSGTGTATRLGTAEGDLREDAPGTVERAVTHPAASRQWVVITSDAQLEEILAQPLERWRTFLHPYQRALVE
ncbi:MAG: hypothetical protein QJR01_08025, partial [Kyrpidia sp.]|nr:hypothetical protein [Kyrpidia sp.]